MPDRHSANRSMFWRVLRRSAFANRGRLFVILLALGTGAAITAALLNLQVDAKHRIASEFRSFGANVLITARENGSEPHQRTIESSLYEKIPKKNETDLVSKAALLYGIVGIKPIASQVSSLDFGKYTSAVLVGYDFSGTDLSDILPSSVVSQVDKPLFGEDAQPRDVATAQKSSAMTACQMGEVLARRLALQVGQDVQIKSDTASAVCYLYRIRRFGGPEDAQLFLDLDLAQKLLEQKDRVNVVALSVPGNPASVAHFIAGLRAALPSVGISPVRQFTEAQANIYQRITGILSATVAVVLVLTALCVMAAMTNVAMERKNDVGLMKAIGGSVRRVLRLFLAEAALLGLAGGLIGAAIGVVISIGLGKAVFGVAAQPRLIVYPVSVALTVIVAILAAYPLRRLVHIRPASVFRGEE